MKPSKSLISLDPFLCIITPVFDPALEAVKKLTTDLQQQTLTDFIHVLISNGKSPLIKQYIEEFNNPHYFYDEMPEELLSNKCSIFLNIGKRREFCLKKFNAHRYLFLDADFKILDNQYFSKLKEAHHTADILLTQVVVTNGTILPKFPIASGRIDLANYSVSKNIAKKFFYPTTFDGNYSNDYRYYEIISENNPVKYLSFISGERDGNKEYNRLSER